MLDGWWLEGFNGGNGWAIGAEIDDGATDFQNEVDASSLYQLFENQIVPLYLRETRRQTSSRLAALDARIHSERYTGVQHAANGEGLYTEKLYIPAVQAHENLSRDDSGAATHLSHWKTPDPQGLATGAGF